MDKFYGFEAMEGADKERKVFDTPSPCVYQLLCFKVYSDTSEIKSSNNCNSV